MALHNEKVPVLGTASRPWRQTYTIPPRYGVARTGPNTVILRVFLPDGTVDDYEFDLRSAMKVGRDLIKNAETEDE